MKTIKDLDELISEAINAYRKNEERKNSSVREFWSEFEKENSKLRKKAAFYNDMRLYLLHNPTEESLNNQLNKSKHDLSIANERLNESIANINSIMVSDFEKEKLIQQAKSNHEHYYSMRKLKKHIANLKFLLS